MTGTTKGSTSSSASDSSVSDRCTSTIKSAHHALEQNSTAINFKYEVLEPDGICDGREIIKVTPELHLLLAIQEVHKANNVFSIEDRLTQRNIGPIQYVRNESDQSASLIVRDIGDLTDTGVPHESCLGFMKEEVALVMFYDFHRLAISLERDGLVELVSYRAQPVDYYWERLNMQLRHR